MLMHFGITCTTEQGFQGRNSCFDEKLKLISKLFLFCMPASLSHNVKDIDNDFITVPSCDCFGMKMENINNGAQPPLGGHMVLF
ncbi:hypothetical protein VNO80_26535 [Phaseolus coccineus]|uniref:Uncharacterized protein n=1 Tax=Phaseolus coccineus TaxID=3886 RepID=A0AAN9QGR7_PHACN